MSEGAKASGNAGFTTPDSKPESVHTMLFDDGNALKAALEKALGYVHRALMLYLPHKSARVLFRFCMIFDGQLCSHSVTSGP